MFLAACFLNPSATPNNLPRAVSAGKEWRCGPLFLSPPVSSVVVQTQLAAENMSNEWVPLSSAHGCNAENLRAARVEGTPVPRVP